MARKVRSLSKKERSFNEQKGLSWMCAYCGIEPSVGMDHVYPLHLGGGNHSGNKVPACEFCNNLKSTMVLDEFRLLILNHLNGENRLRKGLCDRVEARWSVAEGKLLFHFEKVRMTIERKAS